MFGIITKDQYETFLKGEIPDSIPTRMKDHITSLKESDGGSACFVLGTSHPNWGPIEHMIEYICPEDFLAHDNAIKL